MAIRLLPLSEFHSVYLFRIVTLVILLVMGGMIVGAVVNAETSLVSLAPLVVVFMAGRFALEWFRVSKCQPVFVHGDDLVVASSTSHRQVPLTSIRAVTSKHSLFMVRRYRSFTDHLAFVELTLNNGERLLTLAESAVLEFPAGKQTVEALRAAIVEAKAKSLATHR